MRVLLTTDTIGGVWTFTKDLVTELLHQGHDTVLISFGRLPSPTQQAWCVTTQKKYQASFEYVSSEVPLEWMDDNNQCYSRGVSLILKVAARFHPDIVHSNQFCYGTLPLLVPVVVTAHSDVLSWAAACLPGRLANSPWLDQYCSLVSDGLSDASTIVAPTQWMLQALRQGFSFTAPTQTILNGRSIVLPKVKKARKLQAVSVGRLWDQAKNLALLASTKSPMSVLVAGEQQYENAAAPDSYNALTIMDHLHEADLLALFTQSSVYIAPSIYEPFGLAPLEAALCGCAVVANDLPSLREVWGEAALYFKDVPTLEQLLNQLADSEELLKAAQTRSLQRAVQLSSKRMADQYIALYRSLQHSQKSSTLQEQATHVC